jgi:hypothetical protein
MQVAQLKPLAHKSPDRQRLRKQQLAKRRRPPNRRLKRALETLALRNVQQEIGRAHV